MESSLIIISMLLFSSAPAHSQQPKFDYLSVKGQTIESTHRIKYRLEVDRDFKLLGEYHHQPRPAMFLKQYLIASADGSAEYVLSYGRRVASCGNEVITPQFKSEVEREAKALLKVKKR